LKVARIQLDGEAPVAAVARDGAFHPLAHDVGALIAGSPAGAEQPAVERSGDEASGPGRSARLLPPVVPGKVVAIGLNYQDHIRESGQPAPKVPLVFAKFPTSVIADGVPIRLPQELTERVDWEVELAAVIGRRAHAVAVEDALDHVFGYTIGNDVSARDLQFSDGQWVRAKSLDTFCPLGPVLVTADEIPDPQALRLVCRVNGEVMQDATTDLMLFGVAELISFCSHSFTLEPGDVILTGTPWGCGEFMDPKRSLAPGDVVECEIEGIGTLRNPVVEA
jgi:2-keto-4-pentenoate hydratase/2-oxohepta-3-ene-1,7-dioic acid hydratase in catechol pathway